MIFPLPLVIILGLIVGGIINALSDDLPHYRPPRTPRYPDGEARPLIAWLGITAFLFGKRASSKGAKLSWRHPLTELATVGLMVLATAVASQDILEPNSRMSAVRAGFWLAYAAIMVLVTVIDVEHRLILFAVMIPSGILALVDAFFEPFGPSLQEALLGGLLGFGVFYLMYLGGFLFVYISNNLRDRKISTVAFGYGDVMLMTVAGLILGWQSLIFAMFITVFLGAAGAIIYLVGRSLVSSGYHWFTPLPYGPYIVIAVLIMLFFSAEVGQALLR
jgi:leader peptidase (prepilin peptidase)/N-methyltransferase